MFRDRHEAYRRLFTRSGNGVAPTPFMPTRQLDTKLVAVSLCSGAVLGQVVVGQALVTFSPVLSPTLGSTTSPTLNDPRPSEGDAQQTASDVGQGRRATRSRIIFGSKYGAYLWVRASAAHSGTRYSRRCATAQRSTSYRTLGTVAAWKFGER